MITPKEFFQIIKVHGKISSNQKDIAYDLITKIGISTSIHTVDAWLKDKRPLPLPETINENNFIQYFDINTKTTWPNIQQAFSNQGNYGIINCETKDPRIFYLSLLQLFYELIRLVPVSLLHILPEKPLLIGRKNELNQITKIFEETNYLILTGVGGIGKSHIASAYAHLLNQSNDWIVQHIICEESDNLQKAINRLEFDGLKMPKKDDDTSIFNCKIDALKNSLKPKLIILDNLNQSSISGIDEILKTFTNCGQHVRFLITSRNTLRVDKKHIVYILPLGNDTLLELYEYYRFEDSSEHNNYIIEHKDVITKIFALFENHTLMITLLARLPKRLFINENELYNILDSGITLPSEISNMKKDGINTENTIKELMKKIFDISQLTDSEKKIMMYMSIMPPCGVLPSLFEELTGCNKGQLSNLINSHWIIMNQETLKIRLHPLICDVMLCYEETKLSQEMCTEFTKTVIHKRDQIPQGTSDWHTLNKIVACIATKLLFPPIRNFNSSNEQNLVRWDNLKDEYKNALLDLNNYLKKS